MTGSPRATMRKREGRRTIDLTITLYPKDLELLDKLSKLLDDPHYSSIIRKAIRFLYKKVVEAKMGIETLGEELE